MHRCEVDALPAGRHCWVPALVSPERDWAGAPGCRKGARYLVNALTLQVSRDAFEAFPSQAACLEWIMRHRAALNRSLPGARIRAVPLDRWLLGLE